MNDKKSEEVLAEVYRNSRLALQSISDVLPETQDEPLREELRYQHDEYEKIGGKAVRLAEDKNVALKGPGPIKKAMMWSGIKMNTLTDSSRSHIAEMMVRGTVMGITALKSSLGEMQAGASDADIRALAEEMLALEETFEARWKALL